MSQMNRGAFPSLQEMMDEVYNRQRRIAAGDTMLAELDADASMRATASPEYADWRAAVTRLRDYEAELDAAEGISVENIVDGVPTLQQIGDEIDRRKRRIAAGDTKLEELEAAAASVACDKVPEAEMTEAHWRGGDQPS